MAAVTLCEYLVTGTRGVVDHGGETVPFNRRQGAGERVYSIIRTRRAAVSAAIDRRKPEVGIGFFRNLNAKTFNASIGKN